MTWILSMGQVNPMTTDLAYLGTYFGPKLSPPGCANIKYLFGGLGLSYYFVFHQKISNKP